MDSGTGKREWSQICNVAKSVGHMINACQNERRKNSGLILCSDQLLQTAAVTEITAKRTRAPENEDIESFKLNKMGSILKTRKESSLKTAGRI